MAKDPQIGSDYIQFARKYFAEKAIRLIALLALNDRAPEAKRISRRARRVWINQEFHRRLETAERGEFD